MKEEVIQFVGLNDLSSEEQHLINALSTEYFGKAKRTLKNLTSLVVHVKCYQKEGTRKKFSLHLKCKAPGKVFDSDKAHGWELAKVLHQGFKALLKQMTNTYRN